MSVAREGMAQGRRSATGPEGRRRIGRGAAILSMGAVLLCPACSGDDGRPPVYPVQGRVRFRGQPTPGAFIVFHPVKGVGAEAIRPTAQVQQDGSFRLTSFDEGDGAPAGEYAVTVEWWKPIKKDREAQPGPNVIPVPYTKSATTPLKVTVAEAANDLPPFEVAK